MSDEQNVKRGQAMAELAVMLPILLILMAGVAEIGFALRNYILVTNAAREGGRFAARGSFSDREIGKRVVSAGGIVNRGGSEVPFLRTHGTEPNAGVIVSRLPVAEDGEADLSGSPWITGVVVRDDNAMGAVRSPSGGGLSPDSRFSIADIRARHGEDVAEEINEAREAAGREKASDRVVVVEVFYAHSPLLLTSVLPVPDPWPMYARSVMREVIGRQIEE